MKMNHCFLWKFPPQLKIPGPFINETWLCQSVWRDKSLSLQRIQIYRNSPPHMTTWKRQQLLQHTVGQAKEPLSMTRETSVCNCCWMRQFHLLNWCKNTLGSLLKDPIKDFWGF